MHSNLAVSAKPLPFVDAVRAMGNELKQMWNAQQGSELFADTANSSLAKYRLHETFDEDGLINWLFRQERLPQQFDPEGSFGQPPLTLFWAEDFVIDLLFWIGTETSIHDHGFSGAFVNLAGHSLQVEYSFERQEDAGAGLCFGALTPIQMQILAPGDAQGISVGREFIHSVWHLDIPTVTLVVRTRKPLEIEQHEYWASGLSMAEGQARLTEKKKQFIRYLFMRSHPGAIHLAEEVISAARGVECLMLVEACSRHKSIMAKWTGFSAFVERLQATHVSWLQRALAAEKRPRGLTAIEYSRIKTRDQKLFVAILCACRDRGTLTHFLRQIYSDGDWARRTEQLICALVEQEALKIDLGNCLQIVLRSLLQGKSDESVMAEVQQQFEVFAKTAPELRKRIHELRYHVLLQNLFPPL
jgi:hypothetical protein